VAADRKTNAAPSAAGAGTAGLWAAGLIFVAVCLAYANTLRAPFIFDDGPSITLNKTIRDLWPLGPVLQPPSDGGTAIAGRPVINLSLAINYAISGENPWSYHAANLVIHALAALTLFGLARRTLLSVPCRSLLASDGKIPNKGESPASRLLHDHAQAVAFVTALLWALHPLQTESVTCVIQRTESLVGLFYLLTLYGFVRSADATCRRGRLGWAAASTAACLLGMATKEVMVTAPVIVLLYDRTFVSGSFREAWRRHRWLHYALIATWALLFHLLAGNPLRGGTASLETVTPWQYLLTQCRGIVIYLKLSVWPHPLVLDYGTYHARSIAEVWPQAILLVSLAGGTIWALVRRPVLGFIGAWWFVILSPSSSVVPLVTQTIAEHRVYLPLAAVIALGVGALATRAATLVLPVGAVLALVFGGLTISRNQLYRSPEAMWRNNLAQYPDNPRAYVALAAVADREDRFADAVHYYEEYLRRKPDDHDVRFNYARDLAKVNRRAEALPQFEEVLRVQPGNNVVRINYATNLLALRRTPEAVRQFELILHLDRRPAENHFNLAEALMTAGRNAEALACYQEAVSRKPESGFMQYRLAEALLKAGRTVEAVAAYREAVRYQPDIFAAWVNLGSSLMQLGRPAEAIPAYEAALRLKPADQPCQANLEYARGLVRQQ
jgi:protein O-mannosyl-transferase